MTFEKSKSKQDDKELEQEIAKNFVPHHYEPNVRQGALFDQKLMRNNQLRKDVSKSMPANAWNPIKQNPEVFLTPKSNTKLQIAVKVTNAERKLFQ